MTARTKRRVVLGEGQLAVGNCVEGKTTPSGFIIPTAYGLWDEKRGDWKPMAGCRAAAGQRVRLVAEILPAKGKKK